MKIQGSSYLKQNGRRGRQFVGLALMYGFFVAWPSTLVSPHKETDATKETPLALSTDLYIEQKHGKVEEHVLRKGIVAAHLYMDSSGKPYFFFAFPAKNSGVGAWFDIADSATQFVATQKATPVFRPDNLHGAEIKIRTNTKSLIFDHAVLGGMRMVRYAELDAKVPKEVLNHTVKVEDNMVVIHRKSLNQLAEYKIELIPVEGTEIVSEKNQIQFTSKREVELIVRGMTSEKPVTPLIPAKVFKNQYFTKMDPRKVEAISFLLYQEKFAAGSPRYLSQFGRDALITLYILMETVNAEALEDLIAITISGMHPKNGMISHEQDEGDFASYMRLKERKKYVGVDLPIENYKMIDDDYIFPIVVAEYMKKYPTRVSKFLDRVDPRGLSFRKLILSNFNRVINTAAAFTRKPVYKNLIRILPGESVGQWRDSDAGLGGGVYPFDVNAALVPGALKSLGDVFKMEQLDIYNPELAKQLERSFEVWNSKVVPLFEVRMPMQQLAKYGEQYFRDLRLDTKNLPPAPQSDIRFPGIALDPKGIPVPIMHSDDSLMMTFGYPSPDYLLNVTQRVNLQFPYGLRTPVGILIANPIFANNSLKKMFDDTKYHGRVAWTVQENLLMFGFERQIVLQKLPPQVMSAVLKAKEDLAQVIRAKNHMGGNEVFSVLFVNGSYLALPFNGDAKSNSNQLWSHLRIAAPVSNDDTVQQKAQKPNASSE